MMWWSHMPISRSSCRRQTPALACHCYWKPAEPAQAKTRKTSAMTPSKDTETQRNDPKQRHRTPVQRDEPHVSKVVLYPRCAGHSHRLAASLLL